MDTMGIWQTFGILAGGYIFVIFVGIFIELKFNWLQSVPGRIIITIFMFSTIFYVLAGGGRVLDNTDSFRDFKESVVIVVAKFFKNITEDYGKHIHYYNGPPISTLRVH